MMPERWYVVDHPWGDGSWVNADSPDPHHAAFVCDCAPPVEIEEAQGTPQERAAHIAALHNERSAHIVALAHADALAEAVTAWAYARGLARGDATKQALLDSAADDLERALIVFEAARKGVV